MLHYYDWGVALWCCKIGETFVLPNLVKVYKMNETIPGIFKLEMPNHRSTPIVLDSPHSGSDYPKRFNTLVPIEVLRRAEDTYVDDLFSSGPELGAPILSALFPRSFIDPNRGIEDLDPGITSEPWPGPIRPTEKARLGHGIIWRLCPPDYSIYKHPLSVFEVQARIENYWQPYHQALDRCINEVHRKFGFVWHINCHSMPSPNSSSNLKTSGRRFPDFVLGDRDGTTCSWEFLNLVSSTLEEFGYRVLINDPYKGVEIIRKHGRPDKGRNSLQIEINRGLYMNEMTLERNSYYDTLKSHLSQLIGDLGDYALSCIGAKAAE